ncbi:MAG: threonine/serine exporter family protein [Anaerolineae bacterium]|nr:threonine/serine exporter family protein [Anaerolineae bacterium]
MNIIDFIGLLVQDAIWSAAAAVGFGILFNVPRRALLGCAIGGALGHATRTCLMEFGVIIEISTLIGSTVIGFYGLVMARRYEMPVAMFTISAAVTMVPGVFAFRTMMGMLEISSADPETASLALVTAASNGIKTGLILGAIAIGIAAPALIFERPKPVV